jgi:hypothetical protein
VDRLPHELKMKMARGGPYGGGFGQFSDAIEAWRKEGSLRGLRIDVA